MIDSRVTFLKIIYKFQSTLHLIKKCYFIINEVPLINSLSLFYSVILHVVPETASQDRFTDA